MGIHSFRTEPPSLCHFAYFFFCLVKSKARAGLALINFCFTLTFNAMKTNFIAHELRISYHKNATLLTQNFERINCSKMMSRIFRLIWNLDEIQVRESFYAIYFNSQLDVEGYRKISDGGLDSVLVDIRHLMSTALLCNAVRMAVAHNHPSGNLNPSQADRVLTQKIIDASKILNIELLDHIILTESSYYSFRDEGEF